MGYRLLPGRPELFALPEDLKIVGRKSRTLPVVVGLLAGARLSGKPLVGEGFEEAPGIDLLDWRRPNRVLTIWFTFCGVVRLLTGPGVPG